MTVPRERFHAFENFKIENSHVCVFSAVLLWREFVTTTSDGGRKGVRDLRIRFVVAAPLFAPCPSLH